MKSAAPARQRGVGMFQMILIAAGIIFVAIFAMKVVPPYIRNAEIARIFKTIATDPEMQQASIMDIRNSFSKREDINYITSISPEDIAISRDGGTLVLSASYTVRIPIAGNMTLVLEFNPSSS